MISAAVRRSTAGMSEPVLALPDLGEHVCCRLSGKTDRRGDRRLVRPQEDIGALLLAVASAPAAFLVNAATFAVAALLFSRLGTHMIRSTGSRDDDGAAAKGLRTARATRFVIPLTVIVAMVEFTYGAQTFDWHDAPLEVVVAHDARVVFGRTL